MINARQSEYLLGCKEKLEQLVDILKNEYDYAFSLNQGGCFLAVDSFQLK